MDDPAELGRRRKARPNRRSGRLAPDFRGPLPPEPGLRFLAAAILERTAGLAWDDAERLAGEVLDLFAGVAVSPESARRIADQLLERMDRWT
jgi:hypothetical protein